MPSSAATCSCFSCTSTTASLEKVCLPCACRLDSSSLHLRRDRSAFTDIGAVPFSYKSLMALKRAWTALPVGHRRVEANVDSVILYVVG